MKTFKQFILETPHDNDVTTSWKMADDERIVSSKKKAKARIMSAKAQKVSQTDSHEFYKQGSPHNTSFYAVNRKSNKVDMAVDGSLFKSGKRKQFRVSMLAGAHGSKIRAHEFYHHLIHAGHVHDLVSDSSHSEGAKKVWKKLSKMPNIKLDAAQDSYDFHKQKAILKNDTVNKRFDRNYSNDMSSKKFTRKFVAKADI